MADAPTLEDVGHILTYVAPGFFARSAYATRFPQRARDSFDLLIVMVATSLPLVALANAIARQLSISRNPTRLSYVLLLLGTAVAVGYAFALLRGSRRVRAALKKIGYREEPESMLMARTLLCLPRTDSLATFALSDGRVVSGAPQYGTSDPDAPQREVFLAFPAWYNEASGNWDARAKHGGVLLNLDNVLTIQVDDDPT
jgi:hypothetical protein